MHDNISLETNSGRIKELENRVSTLEELLIKQDASNIAYIKPQTNILCKMAVMKDGLSLQYIKQKTEDICMAAVQQNGLALQYVDIKTDDIIEAALRQNGYALGILGKNINPNLCYIAIRSNANAIKFVPFEDQYSYSWDYAIHKKPSLIKYADQNNHQMYDKYSEIAVKTDWSSYHNIINPSETVTCLFIKYADHWDRYKRWIHNKTNKIRFYLFLKHIGWWDYGEDE